ncbi:NAD(P)-dependent oxidoreductase [Thermoflexibacter ruber]|uniref:D-3-phosphoglycerate dehydrogenase n=1 Tax=Thermoflexibacter ruber TaxID=1003 RepID=A0A1I2AGI2_9BACT|nr:NAD(P)-dependent oxidoreductase [Thermoflexibacter ruber]SFE42083.1 D-3-phosphoglycerate dehydrogenase [Thermoflexibacter ruber]
MTKKILIVDEMHSSLLPMLQEIGFQADYQPKITKEEVLASIGEYEGIVVRGKLKIDKPFLEKAQRLRFIARAGAGLDQIDIEETQKRNIALLNAPEGNRDAVAEHCVGMLLCLFNKINLADKQVRNLVWDREGNRGIELMGKTVGIMGYGNMGRAFAQRLVGFGCRVLAYDLCDEKVTDSFVIKSSLAQIQAEADIFSLHIPLTPENKQIFTAIFFDNFQKNIFIINTARGELLDLQVLKEKLRSGKIRGACLDVLENEKLATMTEKQKEAFEVLKTMDNILFTPHVAGWTVESYIRINEVLVEKIRRLDL